MTERTYGVDVSSFQSKDMSRYPDSKFAIVKSTQGTYYHNPNHEGQLASAKQAGMQVMEYHYANFSNNANEAVTEAQYALSHTKLAKGSYIWLDWEAGDGNKVNYSPADNTEAILAFMNIISSAGYKTGLYAGAALMRNNIHTSIILSKYPNSLWVASYPVTRAVSEPDFNYFPSMNGVAIWQFTSNWKGLNVDANVMLIDIFKNSSAVEAGDDDMSFHPEVKYDQLGVFKVNNKNGADLFKEDTLATKIGHKDYGTSWKISRANNGAVCAGGNQWFSQADGLTKINPLAVNEKAPAVCKITDPKAFTQADAKPGKGIEHLPKGNTYKVFGRVGKYLIVYGKDGGKYLDGDKASIVL